MREMIAHNEAAAVPTSPEAFPRFRASRHFQRLDIAHHLNLGQIEMPVEYPPRIDLTFSNGKDYSIDYRLAATLMALPLFFMEIQLIEEVDHEPLRRLIPLYGSHRDDMRQGYVFPIGEEPDDRSSTGFQSYSPT